MLERLVAAAVFSTLACASIAADTPKAAAVAVSESEAVVELVSIDREARLAVVRAKNGATLTMQLPREAQNLDRVKPGDLFKMRYIEALALALHKGGTAGASEIQTVQLAPKGGTPGGRIVSTKQVTALVNAVDRANRTIVIQGPQKEPMQFKVADEVRSFDEIAVGDTIGVTYTEALVMEMITN